MGFTSIDNMNSEILAGKRLTTPWNKITGASAYTAGRWYNTYTLVGNTSGAGTYPAVALTATTLTDLNAGVAQVGAIQHGGDKTPSKKFLINAEAMCSIATGAPSCLLLVDLLAYYQGINMNVSTTQSMLSSSAGSNILPNRQGSQHSGANVFAFLETQTTTGATALPITITMIYTNNALANPRTGSLSSTGPVLPALGCVSSITPHIINTTSAVTGTSGWPFLPLADGDVGMASVQSIKLSSGTGSASTACLVLCEPLAVLPLHAAAVATTRDYVFTLPRLPQIKDGACLCFLLYAGGAVAGATNFYGMLDVAWG